jgi:hypothetical protein
MTLALVAVRIVNDPSNSFRMDGVSAFVARISTPFLGLTERIHQPDLIVPAEELLVVL